MLYIYLFSASKMYIQTHTYIHTHGFHPVNKLNLRKLPSSPGHS